jgi:hypothetical protein
VTFTVYQSPNLPPGFMRQFTELARKLRRYNLLRRNPARVKFLDSPKLIGFEAGSVSEDIRNTSSPPHSEFRKRHSRCSKLKRLTLTETNYRRSVASGRLRTLKKKPVNCSAM